jgi:Domain of unknown function (DUF4351)
MIKNVDRRVFNYFSMLHRDYGLPVYPIVLFSHHSPREDGDRSYVVEFPDWEVLRFNYRAIRLNHLSWKDYEHQPNPVASALMSKMKIVTSWMQQGIEQGLEKGHERTIATIATIARQLKRKIGTLNAEFEQRLSRLSFDELDLLAEALFDFETPADLDRWLQTTDHSLDRA